MRRSLSSLLAAISSVGAFAQTPSEPASRTDANGVLEPVVETWIAPRPARVVGGQTVAHLAGGGTTFLSTDEPPEGDMPRELAFTPDGSLVLVANRDTDNVTFIDVATRTHVAAVLVGDWPVDIAVTPSGQYAVVPNLFDHTVSIIDIGSVAVVANVPVTGQQPASERRGSRWSWGRSSRGSSRLRCGLRCAACGLPWPR